MQPIVYRKYQELITEFLDMVEGNVLEIGCPCEPEQALLDIFSRIDGEFSCVGVDMLVDQAKLACHNPPYKIRQHNSNDMTCLFEDRSFDVVLCSSVLEHDRYFWKTLREVRRVLKPGGLFFLGVPGYSVKMSFARNILLFLWKILWKLFGNVARGPLLYVRNSSLLAATSTYSYHFGPSDFYRFSEDAVREVLFEGFELLHMESFLSPPRFLGVGRQFSEESER